MKMTAALLAVLIAAPALAQTEATTETATDSLSSRTSATFYTDDTMTTLRPADEVMTLWTSVSAEDQAALRARCLELSEAGTGTGDAAATGDAASGTDTAVVDDTSDTEGTTETGFVADAAKMAEICALIRDL